MRLSGLCQALKRRKNKAQRQKAVSQRPLGSFWVKFNTLFDGLFHALIYVFVVTGLARMWRAAHRQHLWWSGKMLVGSMLMGFGLFNVVEGIVDHHVLKLHHVNETVPPAQWMYWDVGFLVWGAAMLVGGAMMLRRSKRNSR